MATQPSMHSMDVEVIFLGDAEFRAVGLQTYCRSHGWQVIVGIEPDKPEDISDVRRLMNQPVSLPEPSARVRPVSGNDYCPCGSGLKFKKCCRMKKPE